LYDEGKSIFTQIFKEVSRMAGCGCGSSTKPKTAAKAKKAAPKKK
jgi:hypothetical protein